MAHTVYKTKDGKRCVSVTTIIDTCLGFSKRTLINWAIKMCKEGKDPNEIKETAADLGTKVHNALENFIYGVPIDQEVLNTSSMEDVVVIKRAVDMFSAWCDEHKIEVLESELKLVDDDLAVGGTCDGIIKTSDGKIYLLDFKSSKYIVPEYSIQTAAYKYLVEKTTGYKIDGVIIVHISKGFDLTSDDPSSIFSIHEVKESQLTAGLDIFLKLVEIYRLKGAIEFDKPKPQKEEE